MFVGVAGGVWHARLDLQHKTNKHTQLLNRSTKHLPPSDSFPFPHIVEAGMNNEKMELQVCEAALWPLNHLCESLSLPSPHISMVLKWRAVSDRVMVL